MSILSWIEDQKRLKVLNAPKYINPSADSSKGLWTRCDKCGVILYIKHLKENQRVCFGCSYHLQMSSQERIENLLDKVPSTSFQKPYTPTPTHTLTSSSQKNMQEDALSGVKIKIGRLNQDHQNASKNFVLPGGLHPHDETFGEGRKNNTSTSASLPTGGRGQSPRRALRATEEKEPHSASNPSRVSGMARTSSRVLGMSKQIISTWRPLDETVSPCDPLQFHDQKNYTDRLQDAQERTGLQDAIQTGTGMVDGIPIALAVMDFSFMGGSMGSVVGEKITRLIEYATQEGLTLVIVCASGGARMQEGVFSLMQMAKISSALQVYQSCANLLYISILTSPTTGGVTASFAMLGDIIFAEPKALIAFAGRRVIEQTLREDLPDDFQTSEYMFNHGLVDLIVPRRFLREALSETIRLYQSAPFKKTGRIPFGVQNPISFLTEEKVRRRWGSLLDTSSSSSFNMRTRTFDNSSALSYSSSSSSSSPQPSVVVPSQTKNIKVLHPSQSLSAQDNGITSTSGRVHRERDKKEESATSLFPKIKEPTNYRDLLTSFEMIFHLFSKQSLNSSPACKYNRTHTAFHTRALCSPFTPKVCGCSVGRVRSARVKRVTGDAHYSASPIGKALVHRKCNSTHIRNAHTQTWWAPPSRSKSFRIIPHPSTSSTWAQRTLVGFEQSQWKTMGIPKTFPLRNRKRNIRKDYTNQSSIQGNSQLFSKKVEVRTYNQRGRYTSKQTVPTLPSLKSYMAKQLRNQHFFKVYPNSIQIYLQTPAKTEAVNNFSSAFSISKNEIRNVKIGTDQGLFSNSSSTRNRSSLLQNFRDLAGIKESFASPSDLKPLFSSPNTRAPGSEGQLLPLPPKKEKKKDQINSSQPVFTEDSNGALSSLYTDTSSSNRSAIGLKLTIQQADRVSPNLNSLFFNENGASNVGRINKKGSFLSLPNQNTQENLKNQDSKSRADIEEASTINFLNQAIEMASTESVEWRAFYLNQRLSKNTGFLEDFLRSYPSTESVHTPYPSCDGIVRGFRSSQSVSTRTLHHEGQPENVNLINRDQDNILFYKTICRSSRLLD